MAGSSFPDSQAPGARPQTWVEVSLGALRRNFDRFAARFDPSVGIIFSIKKDAYGHGMVEVARAVERLARLEALGVATLAEGLTLRRAAITTPILMMSVLHGEQLQEAVSEAMILTITDTAEARAAAGAASALGRTVSVHLKVDTGMGRLGHSCEEAERSIPAIVGLDHLSLAAISTHLPDGWNDPGGARRQADRLDELGRRAGLAGVPRHIGGGDALALAGAASIGSVRAGIAIYGSHPAFENLEPVMALRSRITYRRRAPAGSKISYGGTFTLGRDSELALVGAGYGNGYPRSLSNRGRVLIRGKPFPLIGRVCMDQIVVDVTGDPSVSVGDEVTLFGRSPGGEGAPVMDVAEVAGQAGTISYELMCVAGQINPRFYVDG